MKGAAKIAVLYARKQSIYKKLCCDVWDKERDARLYRGRGPVVAHPPCRAWGRLKAFAKPEPGERDLAPLAVDVVRRNGGILEHPEGSTLWREKDMPRPVEGKDAFGGYTVLINQSDFGHRAQKATWLYIVGIDIPDLPRAPVELGFPDRLVTQLGRAAREATPERLARWLVEVAMCIDAAGQLRRGSQPDLAGQVEPGANWPAPAPNEVAGAPGQVQRSQPAAHGQLDFDW